VLASSYNVAIAAENMLGCLYLASLQGTILGIIIISEEKLLEILKA